MKRLRLILFASMCGSCIVGYSGLKAAHPFYTWLGEILLGVVFVCLACIIGKNVARRLPARRDYQLTKNWEDD